MASSVILGLDLGLSEDPSALAALERLPPAEGDTRARYDCHALYRWPLRTPYAVIAREVANVTSPPEYRGCDLVVDETGVGRPVVEMIRQAGPKCGRLVPVTITAGQSWSEPQPGCFRVGKVLLISTLQALLGTGRLRLAAGHPETAVLVREIEDYRVKLTESGAETFGAREGRHDDLLLGLAVALFYAERRPQLGKGCVGADHAGARAAAAPRGVFGNGSWGRRGDAGRVPRW